MKRKLNADRWKNRLPHLAVLLLLILFGCFLVWLNLGVEKTPLLPQDGSDFAKARVLSIVEDNLQPDGTRQGSQMITAEITSGPYKGKVCQATSISSYLHGAVCKVGGKIILQVSEHDGALSASVYNYDRGGALYLLAGLFLVLLWVIGGKKGLASAASLVFTFVCILFLYLPMLYRGASPFLSAAVVAVLTTLVTMYLIGGISIKTAASILGTVAGVVASGGIAALFGKLAYISGWNVDDIESLLFVGQNSKLQIGGLLFSGILIAALGAVMDVSMSVASVVDELHAHNPYLTAKELFKSGINVGRDMMGTMSNTLILAFTGGSVSLLVMIYAYNMPYLQIMNMYAIGIEILQGLSGTLGVILTVPFVSAVSAVLMARHGGKKRKNFATLPEEQLPSD